MLVFDSEKGNAQVNVTGVYDNEDRVLEQLGIHRELRREFSKFSTISFALGIMGTAATIASTANTPLLLGGPAVLIWAWLLGAVGCVAIASSVAELVSAYPTAGGVYTSTTFVVPKEYRASISFISAWLTVVGQLATTASVNFALSQMIFAAVTIGSNGTFIASTGQVLGLYLGLNVVIGILNSLPTAYLNKMTKVYVATNLAAIFAVIIGIFVGGRGHLAPSSFVWTSIVDHSGWNNRGFVFFLGLLSVQWVMTDYDAAAHISEEVVNAATTAPLAIVVGASATAVFGFFINVALCYGVRDLSALPGPTGLVFAQILWDNMGRIGGLVVFCIVIAVQVMVGLTCQLASIRSIYAVSRDNALPDRKLLAKVWPVTQTPVNAAIFVVVVQSLFGLLSLASIVAINAVFSITAVALDLTYMIPIIAKLYIHWKNDPEMQFQAGPFYMGRMGYLVNVYAVIWTIFETGILIMPQVFPVNASTMNYAGPIMGGVCGLSWLWYKLYWYRYYEGPSTVLQRSITSDSASRDESIDEKKI
ncbi:hypothetical protein M422DRAFT_74895 [Sphaerobolus stellatus SS14]|uniref:Amino acid permease n=1 Tax=Sphaerobolus stellatus (strain SS14) TaxID=990650 RepID=A0A0C9UCT4_SPHS4|nr:hypothetical protein M422DRAFT_77242 [Sphaerobolus stellatus SS14]KIJ46411.1 hypothetical protein M422DRAFT_74895 [Sphaerobolus stellatus SS14]